MLPSSGTLRMLLNIVGLHVWPKAIFHRGLGQHPRLTSMLKVLGRRPYSRPIADSDSVEYGLRPNIGKLLRILGRCPRLRWVRPLAYDANFWSVIASRSGTLTLIVIGWLCCSFAAADTPQLFDDRYELSLFAEAPDIVTPIQMTFDARGRLLVIESHTHHRPENYQGPLADRIRVVEDTDGDGRADRFSSFHEGTTATTSLATATDGSIYVSTRMRIFRLRDTNGDGRADEETPLVRLETKETYPHNGLCGVTFDGDGNLWFGHGENFGKTYKLVGSDGKSYAGTGQGGRIYRCRSDGSELTLIARGLWNPFGICVDPRGRVFTVDNDPDSMPPCRLIHVVPGADYGFQFRYGRSGLNPLTAWNGELPGTLPMMAGTGESPAAILPHDGKLWVTSWGDHRIERYVLKPKGASWTASREVVVQGGVDFRPVGFALAPDGSIYFSDWVDVSYPVHGKGRIWRLRPKTGAKFDSEFPELTDAEQLARSVGSDGKIEPEFLASDDPFLQLAEIWDYVNTGVDPEQCGAFSDPRARVAAWRAYWLSQEQQPNDAQRDKSLQTMLGDTSPEVRVLAVRWIAGARLTQFRQTLLDHLDNDEFPPRYFPIYISALDWLARGTALAAGSATDRLLLREWKNKTRPPQIHALALRWLSPDNKTIDSGSLMSLARHANPQLAQEAVRTLAIRDNDVSRLMLRMIAIDSQLPDSLRADAIVGLAADAQQHRDVLTILSKDRASATKREAIRSLRGVVKSNRLPTEAKPLPEDLDAWLALVGTGGDVEAGRRAFFNSKVGNCASCHRYEARGAQVGPDLTRIGQRSRREILESILLPSRNVAPNFTQTIIELDDGRILTGQSLFRADKQPIERLLQADGATVDFARRDVVARRQLDASIMPRGLEKTISIEELRDLLAFLSAAK